MEHLPHPHQAIPGDIPQVGQWVKYELQNGDLWPCFITAVLEESPDGTRFNVKAVKGGQRRRRIRRVAVRCGERSRSLVPAGPPWVP